MSSLRKTSQPFRWPIENKTVRNPDAPSGPVVVYSTEEVLKDLNRYWQPKARALVEELWIAGKPYAEINAELTAAGMGRKDDDELALCIMELARRGNIDIRPGGVYGTPAK